jgi:retinol dehydrogenase-12
VTTISDRPAHADGRLVYLVTGANSGIGRATADALAARGGRVILAARSAERTRPVIEAIRARQPDAEVEFLSLDLADLASVKRTAESLLSSGRRLDALINNAGLAGPRALTADGFDITFGTNHLGPFLFTNLLLPMLRMAPQGRIVNVSSRAQMGVKNIDWGWLAHPPAPALSIGRFARYAVTKLMNTIHAKELARRLAGTRLTTYSLHPGVVASNIWRELPRPVQVIMKMFMTSNEAGAATSVYCATAPELATVSGRFYERSQEAAPNPLANDESLGRELFARSEEAIASVLGPE